MTSKETIKEFEHLLKVEKDRIHKDVVFITALENAIEALEKQIPKKLTIKLSEQMIQGYLYRDKCCYCPTCDSFRGNLDYEPQKIRKYDFCPDCGQTLDWGGEDE